MGRKKIVLLFSMLTVGGCSLFNPTLELTNEEIFEQYKRQITEINGSNIVESVKSHECKFIKYEAPESRLNPIFGCEIVLRLTETSEDSIDDAIFTRSGADNSNFTSYLVQSKLVSIIQDKAFERLNREKLNN